MSGQNCITVYCSKAQQPRRNDLDNQGIRIIHTYLNFLEPILMYKYGYRLCTFNYMKESQLLASLVPSLGFLYYRTVGIRHVRRHTVYRYLMPTPILLPSIRLHAHLIRQSSRTPKPVPIMTHPPIDLEKPIVTDPFELHQGIIEP